LKRQLLATDLTQELGTIEVSRSVADHLADMLPRSAPHLRSSFCASRPRSTTVSRFNSPPMGQKVTERTEVDKWEKRGGV